ncbi:hypothetical protein BH24ACT1_BH24ACT1_10940 [soil metagenome]
MRRRLGLSGGQELDVFERDGIVELRPVVTEVRMVEREGVLVAEAEVDGSLPVLTADAVRATLEHVRQ